MDVKSITDHVHKMIAAPSCCAELKAAGTFYLNSIGQAEESGARSALIKEIKEDIVPIDGLIEFLGTPHAAEIFGDGLEPFLAKAKEAKDAGAKYCICEACTHAQKVLELLGQA